MVGTVLLFTFSNEPISNKKNERINVLLLSTTESYASYLFQCRFHFSTWNFFGDTEMVMLRVMVVDSVKEI